MNGIATGVGTFSADPVKDCVCVAEETCFRLRLPSLHEQQTWGEASVTCGRRRLYVFPADSTLRVVFHKTKKLSLMQLAASSFEQVFVDQSSPTRGEQVVSTKLPEQV